MMNVMVVDDEPGALAHICTVIAKKCPGFEVAGTAENGAEALEKVAELKPDLVISDIKMPLMNGVELAAELKREYPYVKSLIVSGYQDFEYAKGALQSGVCDYILKPISPSELKKSLDKIEKEINECRLRRRNELLHRLCCGKSISTDRLKDCFSFARYYLAIIRENGLPRRLSTNNEREIYSEPNEEVTVYGRDEREELLIIPKELLFHETFKEYIFRKSRKKQQDNNYITVVYCLHSIEIEELKMTVEGLYKLLNQISIIGQEQMLDSVSAAEKVIQYDNKAISAVLERLEEMIKNRAFDKFQAELERLFRRWTAEKKPQLWVEQLVRQILQLTYPYGNQKLSLLEYEYMMEDAFFYSTSMRELYESLIETIFCNIKNVPCEVIDSMEYFEQITEYMENKLAEHITLQSVCKSFGISQTYLSKLFRKYVAKSFNQYLTGLRIEKAKQVMDENPRIFIKEVAEYTGFNDQFYFSRVFRSYVGECPSDYMEKRISRNEEEMMISLP